MGKEKAGISLDMGKHEDTGVTVALTFALTLATKAIPSQMLWDL